MTEYDWYRWNEKKERWEFNHRSRDADEPIPRSDFQRKAWAGAKWRREPVTTSRE